MKDHWEATGAKWIWIVVDAGSPEQASEWLDSQYVTYGWGTSDSDNSEGTGAVATSPNVTGVPWIGVIRTSDMQLVYDESDGTYLDIRTIAEELASP